MLDVCSNLLDLHFDDGPHSEMLDCVFESLFVGKNPYRIDLPFHKQTQRYLQHHDHRRCDGIDLVDAVRFSITFNRQTYTK